MIRSDLARKLHLSDGAPIAIVTATGETCGYRIIAGSVAVGGLAAEHLEINALEQTRALTGRIQGVLGENFLRNFDVLLDYEQQTLVTCEGLTRNKMDTDGLLPTDVFHRFFISHKGGYVIAHPRSLEKLDDPSVELDRGR
jgi:hypothetical protein